LLAIAAPSPRARSLAQFDLRMDAAAGTAVGADQRVLAHAALEAEIHQAFEKFPRWSVLDFSFGLGA